MPDLLDVASSLTKMVGNFDPLDSLISTIGGAVGLPKGITDAAKVVAGAMTGDLVCLADGATGMAGDLRDAAATEYASHSHCAEPAGYAPPRYRGPGCEGGRPPGHSVEGHVRPPPGHGTQTEEISRHSVDIDIGLIHLHFGDEVDRTRHDASPVGPSEGGSCGETPPPGVGTPPMEPPTQRPGCGGGRLQEILSDPSMSIEDKLDAIMSMVLSQTDDAMVNTASELAKAQDDANKVDSKDTAGAAKAKKNVEDLQEKLQKLTERRTEMFQLRSTLSQKWDEMAKVALGNMGRG